MTMATLVWQVAEDWENDARSYIGKSPFGKLILFLLSKHSNGLYKVTFQQLHIAPEA
jgi:hypothetical protein